MDLLSEADIAKQIGVSLATVRRWRRERTGPPYVKIAASVRYRQEDVDAYVAKSIVRTSVSKYAEGAGT